MLKGTPYFFIGLLSVWVSSIAAAPLSRVVDRSTNDQKVQVTVFKALIDKMDSQSHQDTKKGETGDTFLSLGGFWVSDENDNNSSHEINYPERSPSNWVMAQFAHHRPRVRTYSQFHHFLHKVPVELLSVVHIRWVNCHYAIVQAEAGGQTPGMEGTVDLSIYEVMCHRNHWSVVKSKHIIGIN